MMVRKAIIKKSINNKCWREYGEKGTLLHYGGMQTGTATIGEQCGDSLKNWK